MQVKFELFGLLDELKMTVPGSGFRVQRPVRLRRVDDSQIQSTIVRRFAGLELPNKRIVEAGEKYLLILLRF